MLGADISMVELIITGISFFVRERHCLDYIDSQFIPVRYSGSKSDRKLITLDDQDIPISLASEQSSVLW